MSYFLSHNSQPFSFTLTPHSYLLSLSRSLLSPLSFRRPSLLSPTLTPLSSRRPSLSNHHSSSHLDPHASSSTVVVETLRSVFFFLRFVLWWRRLSSSRFRSPTSFAPLRRFRSHRTHQRRRVHSHRSHQRRRVHSHQHRRVHSHQRCRVRRVRSHQRRRVRSQHSHQRRRVCRTVHRLFWPSFTSVFLFF